LKINVEQLTTCGHNKMPKYYNIFNQKIQNEMFKYLITIENHTEGVMIYMSQSSV